MNYQVFLLAIVGSILATSVRAGTVAVTEGKKFFEHYVALGERYDPALADLYLDQSRIMSLRRYPTGQTKTLELNGSQWKQLIRAAMPTARARGDRSEFRNVRIEPSGDLVRVQAERYSAIKCYWDKGYYMLIGRHSDGSLRIMEEYSETQPQSDC